MIDTVQTTTHVDLIEIQCCWKVKQGMDLIEKGSWVAGGGSQKLEILNVDNNIIFSKSLQGLLSLKGPPESTDKNV